MIKEKFFFIRLFNSFFICVCSILLIFSILYMISSDEFNAYSHLNGSKIQEVIDSKDNIKILFTYTPEKPIIDTFTKFSFSIEDLEGNHIEDKLPTTAFVTVTNGQRLFKFENISIINGHFNVEYIFPDDGTHQVITRIDTNTSIIPALFNVFVPHQAPPNILNPFPAPVDGEYGIEIIISIILAITIPIAAVISLIIIIKKH